MKEEEIQDNAKGDLKKSINKGSCLAPKLKGGPIWVSNEDLKKVYERSKNRVKSIKPLHFENAHQGKEVSLYENFIL